jgi:hypothetical protein
MIHSSRPTGRVSSSLEDFRRYGVRSEIFGDTIPVVRFSNRLNGRPHSVVLRFSASSRPGAWCDVTTIMGTSPASSWEDVAGHARRNELARSLGEIPPPMNAQELAQWQTLSVPGELLFEGRMLDLRVNGAPSHSDRAPWVASALPEDQVLVCLAAAGIAVDQLTLVQDIARVRIPSAPDVH